MQRLLIALSLIALVLVQVQPSLLQAQGVPSQSPTPTAPTRRSRGVAAQPVCVLADRARTELAFARLNAMRESLGLPPAAWDEEAHQLAAQAMQRALAERSLNCDLLLQAHSDLELFYSRQMTPIDLSAPDSTLNRIPCPECVQRAERMAVAGIVCRRSITFKFKPGIDMSTASAWLIYTDDSFSVSGSCR